MKRLAPVVLATVLLAGSGCHIFSSKKNPAAPKESKTVATDTERDFMRRWIDKRTADLVTKGLDAGAAHQQAVAEYKTTFAYTKTADQAK
jgi:hypothetical protein